MINTVVVANEINRCPCGNHKTCQKCEIAKPVVKASIIDNVMSYEP